MDTLDTQMYTTCVSDNPPKEVPKINHKIMAELLTTHVGIQGHNMRRGFTRQHC